ncbi:hypothetical protein [Nocardia asiatica]|uniref:hypothetical protein n=1 Tax=Nocardia asiatica TaxID=209252 RepID=UPI002457CF59|nr:hypothetical protein [Nocardia asiatica]
MAKRAIGGPLPPGMPLPRFERIGIGIDGRCIYERLSDEPAEDTQPDEREHD